MKEINKIAAIISALSDEGWRQVQIAEYLNVSQPAVSQLKNGNEGVVSKESLPEIKAALERLINEEGLVVTDVDIQNELSFADWFVEQLDKLKLSIQELSKATGLAYLTIYKIKNGETKTPQQETRQIIEAAIHRIADEKGAGVKIISAPQEKVGFFEAIDFTPTELEKVPNGIGLYSIYDQRGFPLYVGKGKLRDRLLSHSEETAFAHRRVADKFSYYLIEGAGLSAADADKKAQELETLILKFLGNLVLLNDKKRARLNQ